jgi:hypothetical protein
MGFSPIVSSCTRSIAMSIKSPKDVIKLIAEEHWKPKQMDEAAHVRGFLSKVANPPAVALFVVERDPPDFVAKSEDSEWAIEHTRIFREIPPRPRKPRGEETERERFVSDTEKIYERLGGDPVCVQVDWVSNQPIDRQFVPVSAERLAKIVLAVAPPGGPPIDKIVHHELEIPGCAWPEGVGQISVHRHDRQKQSLWSPHGGGWHIAISAETIQQVINEKGIRRPEYASEWPSAWLVIVVEFDRPSSFLSLDQVLVNQEFESAFDRTFIWRHVDRQHYELHTRQPRSR